MSKEHFTLDEAIAHCYEVSKKKDICKECADEHLQLAKWLKELKTLRQEKNDLVIGNYYTCIIGPNPYSAVGFMVCEYIGNNMFKDPHGTLRDISMFERIEKLKENN